MLYDPKWETKAPTAVSLAYPSLAALAHLLRNEQLWPKNFMWRGRLSPMKLVEAFWPNSIVPSEKGTAFLYETLATGLSPNSRDDLQTYYKIFYADEPTRMPTASDVANRIDAYLSRHNNHEAYKALLALRFGC